MLFLFYKDFVADDELEIKYADVMKQVGNDDCGLFCIAYAVDLAEGNDPSGIDYNQVACVCFWWSVSKKENWLNS